MTSRWVASLLRVNGSIVSSTGGQGQDALQMRAMTPAGMCPRRTGLAAYLSPCVACLAACLACLAESLAGLRATRCLACPGVPGLHLLSSPNLLSSTCLAGAARAMPVPCLGACIRGQHCGQHTLALSLALSDLGPTWARPMPV